MNNGQFEVSAKSIKEASVAAIADLTNENIMLKALAMDLSDQLNEANQKLESLSQTGDNPA